MKKYSFKKYFLWVALSFLLVMTGCSAGSTIDTKLTLNEDLSGSRQMEIVIDQDVFSEYFMGSIEDLNVVIGEACPDVLTWDYNETAGVMKYDIVLDFASVEDYKEKVTEILGEEPEISISTPDSIWANGVYISENFSDTDLLAWMEDAIVSNGFVSESNASMIFTTGEVVVAYNGENHNCSSTIYLDTVEYISIDSIEILTRVNTLDDYDRGVVFTIPQSAMTSKGDQIREYMSEVTPAGADGSWQEDEYSSVFTIKAQNLDAAALQDFNTALFSTESSTVTGEMIHEDRSPFSFEKLLSENIDLSNYVTGGGSSTRVTYMVKTVEPYSAEFVSDGYNSGFGYESEEFPGYMILSENWTSGGLNEFGIKLSKDYAVTSLDVTTDKPLIGEKWTREHVFFLDQIPEAEEQELILAEINEMAGNEAEEETASETLVSEEAEETTDAETVQTEEEGEEPEEKAAVEVSGKESDGIYSVTITQKGTMEQLMENSEELWGSTGSLAYARETGFLKIKKQEAFYESISYGDMLERTDPSFEIHHTAKLGLLSSRGYYDVLSLDTEMKGGSLKTNFTGSSVSVSYAGTKIDVFAILFWILLVIGLVMIMIALLKSGVFKKKVKPAAAPAPIQEPVTPAAQQMPVQAAPVAQFCEKCGTRRETGALFCEQCGAKFED